MWTPDPYLAQIFYDNMADRIELAEPSELSPLLAPPQAPKATTTAEQNRKSRQPWEKIMFVLMVVLLFASCGDQSQESPLIRITESVICYRYFENVDPSKLLLSRAEVGPGAIGGVAEMYCKADEVQSKLAMIRGWQATFDGLPSLVLALPIGWAGDRFGRKPVLLAGLLGYATSSAWKEFVYVHQWCGKWDSKLTMPGCGFGNSSTSRPSGSPHSLRLWEEETQ